MFQEPSRNCVASFVICNCPFLFWGHDQVSLFKSSNHSIHSGVKVIHIYCFLSVPRSYQCGFVAHVRDISSRKPRSKRCHSTSNCFFSWGLGNPDIFEMNVEDILSPLDVRRVNGNLPIESSWAKERVVQDVDAIGATENNDARVGSEAVQFDEELVKCILPLVVSSNHAASPTSSPNRINLINKNNARCKLPRLREEISNSRWTNTDKHFHEVRARHCQEWYTGFASSGSRKESFPGPWWTMHQSTFRNSGSKLFIFCWVLQVRHKFHDLLFRLIKSCDILECGLNFSILDIEYGGVCFSNPKNTSGSGSGSTSTCPLFVSRVPRRIPTKRISHPCTT
mmetsp:Transcript_4657/g.9372  ORF Transcript_4657/g.9372 Transcript_4657/m.9372 type:complete len:339 (-) Transcript_4657:704-1720(-)